jgi:hypothetical protein
MAAKTGGVTEASFCFRVRARLLLFAQSRSGAHHSCSPAASSRSVGRRGHASEAAFKPLVPPRMIWRDEFSSRKAVNVELFSRQWPATHCASWGAPR